MKSIKELYPDIDHPIFLKLLEILPRQQEFLQAEQRKREEKAAFERKVFGDAVKQLIQFSPFKELREKALKAQKS